MIVPLLIAVVVLLLLSLVVALPNRNKGCLLDLAHILALVAGSVAPALVVYFLSADKPVAWWFWVLLVLSVPFSACAVGLAAFGWQTFFPGWVVVRQRGKGRRKAAAKGDSSASRARGAKAAGAAVVAGGAEPDLEQQVDLSLFDPSAYMYTPQPLSNTANYDALGDCLFALLIGIVGGLFWIGLQLAQGITKVLLPGMPAAVTMENAQEMGARRATRALLCFVYAVVIAAGTTIALYFAGGGASRGGPVGG